jgi:hypothetical protein
VGILCILVLCKSRLKFISSMDIHIQLYHRLTAGLCWRHTDGILSAVSCLRRLRRPRGTKEVTLTDATLWRWINLNRRHSEGKMLSTASYAFFFHFWKFEFSIYEFEGYFYFTIKKGYLLMEESDKAHSFGKKNTNLPCSKFD